MAVNGDELDTSVEFERQLDDDQLMALTADMNRRMGALLSQGVPLPVAQIEGHHLLGLLEAIAGKTRSLKVREWHLTWLDRQLDEAEAAVRAQLLKSGIFDNDPADVPGFP